MRSIEFQGYTYWIGENARDNTAMVEKFKEENSKYYWFHLEDKSSAHVILASSLETVKDKKERSRVLKYGALLCKQKSRVVQHEPVEIIGCRLESVIPTGYSGEMEVVGNTLKWII